MKTSNSTPNHRRRKQKPRSSKAAKVATAVTAGGSLLILSALILAGTVIGLTIVTPLFVLFSPVLVPALIALMLLGLGFTASGGFGVAAVTAITWIYRYVTGQHPAGSDQLQTARHKLTNKARDIKDYAQQNVTGGQGS
ncbi:oleosin 1-like [Neltuma alba]|uniref:oleosin 1-like n=1 Tax=Neltuma alba TaxID=207710 RepID=UPI0010A3ED86|nr:oleosin 1-like [Prosopis alba]